jgi:hypothetical protein
MGFPKRITYHAGGKDSVGALLMNPSCAPHGGVDYARANRIAIREKERAMKARRAEEEAEPAKAFTLSKFKDVPSRLHESPPAAPSHEGVQFLRRGAAEQRASTLRERALKVRERMEADEQLPRREGGKPALPPFDRHARDSTPPSSFSTKNFVAANRISAASMKPHTPAEEKTSFRHSSQGVVPDYLVQRQKQWAKDEADFLASQPDPNAPPGTVLMTDQERIETLRQLTESECEVRKQLASLPLVIQTAKMRRRQEDLETQLGEIEGAIAIFARPKVYVAR